MSLTLVFFCQRIEHEDRVFFGLRAPSETFEDYLYLLKVSDSCNWSGAVQNEVAQATRYYEHHTSMKTHAFFNVVLTDHKNS